MTLLTMLAHERAATIAVAVQAVTFVLVERGDGGARMSCGTAPSFQQRERERAARGGAQGGHTCRT